MAKIQKNAESLKLVLIDIFLPGITIIIYRLLIDHLFSLPPFQIYKVIVFVVLNKRCSPALT